MTPLIETRGLVKAFPPRVVALDNVSIDFAAGEIHAVVGENGAGKSTLMKVLYGLERAEEGEVYLHGRRAEHRSPAQAIEQGLGMVHQEILLVTEYTVWENVVLGAEPVNRFGAIRRRHARDAVAARIDEYGFNLDPDASVRSLSVAARQKVEILKLLYRDVEILILDEPTAVLTPQEIPQLFRELRRLRDAGKTILFVSHHLEEVLDLSDRVSVMRRGRLVDTLTTTETTRESLAKLMVGRSVIFAKRRAPQGAGTDSADAAGGAPIFSADHLQFINDDGVSRLQDVSLTVDGGEIVGIAGVEGNGQFELVNCIMGVSPPQEGRITVAGRDLTESSVLDRRRWISYVSQDRSRLGASVRDSIVDNARMTHHRLNPRFSHRGCRILDDRAARTFVEDLRDRFSVVMGGPEEPFRSLSGGNQQKVILARELLLETPFVLLDQPTRGLDVGSIEYVHDTILDLRARGRAVLLISADLEELFRLADRILVIYRGRIALDKKTEDTDYEEVGRAMLRGTGGSS